MNNENSKSYLIVSASKNYGAGVQFFCFGQSTGGFSCIKVEKGRGITEVAELKEIQSLGSLQQKSRQELMELLNDTLCPTAIID
ncbi:hypothetical protein FHW36_11823 [Chitinophaga polysaccharea]|uniref:Uncharacterized protein n=1 Tax=Chitinophaga polysaccharea TaxID=1293035 RepID=A0A561P0S3_9BACT|nr:hypothetical protein [Chitinophaga polysaccharea]TWF31729.1 hypothetical protein FHW36_11823 [Chitinophaga polysaccharea]